MSLKTPHLYEFDEFVLDTSERQLWRGEESIPIPLKAIETLCLLVENHGKLLSKDILMDALWKDTFVEERNLAQNIFTLRKKLGEDNNGRKFIETVPKLGYRFVADVSISETTLEEIEVSLENKTTVSAEGDFTSEELAEAVRSTAESLKIDRNLIEPKIKQIDSVATSKAPSKAFPIAVFLIGLFSIVTFGAGIWFWNSNGETKVRTTKFEIAKAKLERITNSGQAWHPAVSPDNKYVAYVSQSGENTDGIQLQNLATGSITEVTNTTNAEFGSPAFGKNGDYIYYTARDGGRFGTLYRTPILGGSKQRIDENVLSDIAISPDGEWLTFVRSRDLAKSREIIICRVDGSEERVVKTRAEPNGYMVWGISPSWSPDGKSIIAAAFSRSSKADERENQYLVEIEVETGVETKLKAPKFHEVSQPRFMPDGKSIVVLARIDPNSPRQVWQISYPGGKTRRITNDLFDYSMLNVSPDGTYLLTNERINTSNLCVVDATSGKIIGKLTDTRALTNGSNGLTWTPDGTKIVYSRLSRTAGNIWSYDLASKQTRQITFDENTFNGYPNITPDGKSVIFESSRSGNRHVWKINLDGSGLTQLTTGPAIQSSEISPDGKWFFYGQSGVLWRKPLSGGEKVEFLKRGGQNIVSKDSRMNLVHYFDPDEKKTSPWKRKIMSTDDNRDEDSHPLKLTAHRALDWSADGLTIFYAKPMRNKSNVWIYSITNKTSRLLTDFSDQQIDYLAVSPDGKRIAIARGTSNSEIIKISDFNK